MANILFKPTAGDPLFANVEFLVINETGKADGNTVFTPEQSSHGYTVTRGGNAQWDTGITPPSPLTATALFAGTGDQLTMTDAVTELGTSDFTLEGFVYFTSLAILGSIVTKGTFSGGTCAIGVQADSGNFYYFMSSNGTSNDIANFPIILASPSTATWYYWAIKRVGTAITSAYKATPVAGQATTAGGGATSSASVWDSTTGWFIGNDSNNAWLTGNIGCVRLTLGASRDITVVPTFGFPTS